MLARHIPASFMADANRADVGAHESYGLWVIAAALFNARGMTHLMRENEFSKSGRGAIAGS
jgi:hypothetical protein